MTWRSETPGISSPWHSQTTMKSGTCVWGGGGGSGRVGEWESGRVGEWESGRVGEWESGRVGEWEGGGGEGGGGGGRGSGRGFCHRAAGVEHHNSTTGKDAYFAAARKGDLDELRSILNSNKCTDVSVPCVFVAPRDRGWGRWEGGRWRVYILLHVQSLLLTLHIPSHCDTSTTHHPHTYTGGCSLVLFYCVQLQRQETTLRWSGCYRQHPLVPMLAVSDTKMLSTLPLLAATARWSSFSS